MRCEICCAAPEKAAKTDFLTGSQTFKKESLVPKHNVDDGHMQQKPSQLGCA